MKKRGENSSIIPRLQPFFVLSLSVIFSLSLILFLIILLVLGYTDLAITSAFTFFGLSLAYFAIVFLLLAFLVFLVKTFGSTDAAHYVLFLPILLGMTHAVVQINGPGYAEDFSGGLGIFALSLVLVLINYYFLELIVREGNLLPRTQKKKVIQKNYSRKKKKQ